MDPGCPVKKTDFAQKRNLTTNTVSLHLLGKPIFLKLCNVLKMLKSGLCAVSCLQVGRSGVTCCLLLILEQCSMLISKDPTLLFGLN